jgi:hypothetical protein
LAQERDQALAELERFSLVTVTPEIPDPVAHLARISLTHVGPIAGQDDHVITAALARAWRSVGRKTSAALAYARTLVTSGVEEVTPVRDLAWASLTRVERGTLLSEAERFRLTHFTDPREPSASGAWPAEVRWM